MHALARALLLLAPMAAGVRQGTYVADAGGARVAVAAPQPDSVSAAIRTLAARDAPIARYAPREWRQVRRLYEARSHAPLWIVGGRPSMRAAALVDALADAPAQALRLDRYPVRELHDALEAMRRQPTAARLALADALLTAAFVAYADDLLTGQVEPRSVNREWHIDPRDVDVDSALARTLRREPFAEALALLRPQDPEYAALMSELARYRDLVAGGGWPRVPGTAVLRPGDTTTARAVSALLGRLHVEGFAQPMPIVPAVPAGQRATAASAGSAAPVVYDGALAGAVGEYQRRHGLVVDSVVGPATRASLDRPAEYRLRQVAANLERHRWLPRERGDRYVIVNVAAFRLRAYDAGREVLSMNVVVGAEYGGRTTPVFSDSMAYVVFRPYWNVPSGIAARELWPEQRRDPGYFERNGYEVARASWGRYVRQKPGPGNALGFVKFIFPNDFAIYLHDTPAQALFAERARAYSHGCVRVQHPDSLAAFVLGPQGWDIARAREAMDRGPDDRRVYLERKLPVYVVYFTTYVRGGELHFASDVYDRDDALVAALRGAVAVDAGELRRATALRDRVRQLADGQ